MFVKKHVAFTKSESSIPLLGHSSACKPKQQIAATVATAREENFKPIS